MVTPPAQRGSSSLISDVYSRLHWSIIVGEIAPGAPIVERHASERFGVSRSTVRAALQRLEQQGYVVAQSVNTYSRMVVAPLTVDDMDDLYGVIGALDGAGARRAAGMPEDARKALVKEMQAFNSELLRSSTTLHDFDLSYEIDSKFHRCYVRAAAGRRLLAQYDALIPQAERYGRMYARSHLSEIDRSVDEHAVIMAAIEIGDADAAMLRAEENWRNAARRFRERMLRLGDRGTW